MQHANPTPETLPRRKLPIGIQTFREIREDNCYYVDKTAMAVELIHSGKAYFLSRPRRFGKSLFLDTLKELFEGNRQLFTGLAAENAWDWSRKFPVISINLGTGQLHSRAELEQRIEEILLENERALGTQIVHRSISGRFSELIRQAHLNTGQRAVVLIDEYDKPILDNIDDSATASAMREGLKNLYSVLKGADAHLKFVLLTGVSKFSKVSIFSDLNHLRDITLDARYSTLCGYTDVDVDTVFAPELPGLDREEIRRWYNGYNWLGQSVYNPFDLLLLFDNRKFDPYWFETGTPTFLVRLLTERGYFTPDLARSQTSLTLLSAFDVDRIESEALLFQAGYLTILEATEPIRGKWVYTLGYPNREVAASLNAALLGGLGVSEHAAFTTGIKLLDLLKNAGLTGLTGLTGLKMLLHALYASIPHQWYTNNPIARFEGYYASVFYSHFAALGLDIVLEDTTNQGRIDMTVLAFGQVFIFEFKVVEQVPEGKALQQIKDQAYADKYRAMGQPIHLIGIEFSKTSRNITGFEVETLQNTTK